MALSSSREYLIVGLHKIKIVFCSQTILTIHNQFIYMTMRNFFSINNINNNNNNNGGLESDAAVTLPVARHDFLVSFLVDARGGALNGCRHTGVKVRHKNIVAQGLKIQGLWYRMFFPQLNIGYC